MDRPVESTQEGQSISISEDLGEDPFKSTCTRRAENSEFVDALENNRSIADNDADNLREQSAKESESESTTGENLPVERLADRLNRDLGIGTPVESGDVQNQQSCDLDKDAAVGSEASDCNNKRTESENDNVPGEDNSCSEAGSDEEEAYHSAEEGDNIVIDETYLKEIEDTLTEEEKNDRRKEAQALKETGNGLFKAGEYREAVKAYKKALKLCPLLFAKDRSIMYSNRAACCMRMEDVDQAIADSSKAIELNPQYLKAILRRAELYEKGDKLDEALADYQRVIELEPGNHTARAACMRLPDQIKERNEKMKEEMLGKLKDLGNMILKPFGLSTNNFQMQQDPNTGGYSVQFNNNGK